MAIEEGYYWTGNTSHTFGIAKSTDDQLQCFLHENLPDDRYISGQFLTGFESKTLQANAILFEIAKLIRASEALTYLFIATPTKFLSRALHEHAEGAPILKALEDYFDVYGHQGYSLDFIEPTQAEDPSATFATLKSMVQNRKLRSEESGGPRHGGSRAEVRGSLKEALWTRLLAVPIPSVVCASIQPHPRRDGLLFWLHLVRAAANGIRAGSAFGRRGDVSRL